MANCSAGRCHIECDEGQGCACAYIIEDDVCECECFDNPGTGLTGLGAALTNKIDISVSGLPLSQVAALFDRFLADEVLLPVARSNEPVHLALKGVTVAAALKSLALPTQPSSKR